MVGGTAEYKMWANEPAYKIVVISILMHHKGQVPVQVSRLQEPALLAYTMYENREMQTKIYVTSSAEYISMGVYWKLLCINGKS